MSKIPKCPDVKDDIDWSDVIDLASEHMSSVFDEDMSDGVDDDYHHFFEAVIVAIYGNKVWTKYNKAIELRDNWQSDH
jgi:hypothetical protein